MLIGQHLDLAQISLGLSPKKPNYVGIICTKTNVGEVAQLAVQNAVDICNAHYGLIGGPSVGIYGQTDVDFVYIPSHLHHMIFELVKNSLRAVVERYGVEADFYPEIRVVIAEGKEDITVKISDEGGGIARSGMPHVWSYLYTTAEPPDLDESNRSGYRAPLAGFGYGLHICPHR